MRLYPPALMLMVNRRVAEVALLRSKCLISPYKLLLGIVNAIFCERKVRVCVYHVEGDYVGLLSEITINGRLCV